MPWITPPKRPAGSCARSATFTISKEDYDANGSALHCAMLIVPARAGLSAPESTGSCNGGTSPDGSCQRVRWAKPSAMRWLTGDHWRFISKSPESRSILTSLRMPSAQPLLERRTGCFSVTPRPASAAPSSTPSSKVVAVTGSNPIVTCTMSLPVYRP